MKKYEIYFELFGKKMKTTITAPTKDVAKQIVKDKIIFHKIEREPDFGDAIFDFLNINK
jgi:hypothetical protein